MASWAHAEITVDDNETDVEIGFYNVEETYTEDQFDDVDSWEDLLSRLGRDGWEMIQVLQRVDSRTYWFKRLMFDVG